MKLYGYWRSSSAWRVRIALEHKALPYDNIPVHLVADGGQQNSLEHVGRNPMRQVPVLELDDGRCLTQSVAIVEYLDERYPTPPLLPPEPFLRACTRQLVEVVNAGIQPLQNLRVLQAIDAAGGDRAAWGRQVIDEGLTALQALARRHAGRFLVGDELSLADLYLVPQLYNARRFRCDLTGLDLLLSVEQSCQELPAFQRAHPDRQPDAILTD